MGSAEMRLIIAGDGDNGAVEIVGNRFVIGRDADSDLTLDDSKVSRHHAALRLLEDGRVELEDLDSANGTFVNGSRVDKAMLEGGEELQIGRTKLAVERNAAPSIDTEETAPPETRGAETPFMLQLENGDEIEARGERFTIGRDPGSDLTLDDSKVSREHAYLSVRPDGRAELHDRSVNGSFVDGRRIEGTELLQGGEQLRFGGTTIATSRGGAGDRLQATKPDLPSMPPPVPPRPPERDSAIIRMQRSLRRTTILAAIAVAIAIGVGAAFAFGAFSGGGGHPRRHAPTRASITQLERATVLINAYDSSGQQLYSGSGSIITPDGLILTNAHVGDPGAEGLAVQEGLDQWESESTVPDKLVVAIFQAEDQPPTETYTAHSVASDGYLDIAVLKIDGTVNGGSVSNLQLPTVKLGDSDTLRGEDPIRVVGYPAVGGDNVNDSPGTVFGFLSDPHLTDPRAWIKTGTDVVNAGNSGGLAANAAGRLVGIPSQALSRPKEGERQGRIRPINLAKPIINAAKSDTPYTSDYLVRKTGNESVTLTDWATDVPDSSCNYQSTTSYAAGTTQLVAVLSAAGFTDGEDIWVRWTSAQDPTSKGEVVSGEGSMWNESKIDSSCWPALLSSDQALPDGTYSVQVFAGPRYDAVGDPVTVAVGGTP